MSDFRSLPKVDTLASSGRLAGFPEPVRILAARRAIDEARASLSAGTAIDIEARAVEIAFAATRPRMKRVINASGVVLHTGLGRARLAPYAVEAIRLAAEGHSALEIDLQSGKRGDRQLLVKDLLTDLTGAGEAMVVNNCAGAVLLTLAALAKGGEVILSRGQMVEIGGSFRMPDIVRRSGAKLVEVGCTNKVRLADYAEAITPRTRAILRCHPSNFKVVGFSEEPSLAELAALARDNRLPLIDDQGSGCLVDTTKFGLPREPRLGDSIRDGASIVLASGDKLLGGPQAGLILGSPALIGAIRKHPLARTLRIDKLSLTGLAATLQLYQFGREGEIPTLRYLGRPMEEVEEMAKRLAKAFEGAQVEAGLTEVGGGSLPGAGVPTWRCGLPVRNAAQVAGVLRRPDPVSVLTRIERGLVWLDPRTIDEAEMEAVVLRLGSLK